MKTSLSLIVSLVCSAGTAIVIVSVEVLVVERCCIVLVMSVCSNNCAVFCYVSVLFVCILRYSSWSQVTFTSLLFK